MLGFFYISKKRGITFGLALTLNVPFVKKILTLYICKVFYGVFFIGTV